MVEEEVLDLKSCLTISFLTHSVQNVQIGSVEAESALDPVEVQFLLVLTTGCPVESLNTEKLLLLISSQLYLGNPDALHPLNSNYFIPSPCQNYS